MKTIVHALFVGINKYEGNVVIDRIATFPPLGGCVNDVVAVRELLEKDASIDLQALSLTDRQATKANIVKAFEEHLGQAGPDDVVLFYYSGHGTVEQADPDVWTAESDGRLEGIVCYYTQGDSGKFLLSDKELRYMLANLYTKTKAHIVTIFDCCHSGDNTRAVLDTAITNKRPQYRSGFLTFPQRNWSDFVFAEQHPPEFFKNKGIDDALPPGRYVQISACESNESALETRGHGVLTTHLLDALKQTGGNLSYRDLASRIRNQTRYLFEQRPRLYTPNEASELADLGFLKKPVGAMATQAQLIYNAAGEYRLDRGILHHVEPGVTTVNTFGKDGRPVTGMVTSAELDAAVVEFAHEDLLNLPRTSQPATLDNLTGRVVRIQLVNKDLPDRPLQSLLFALNQPENAAYLAFEDDPALADFALVLWRGLAYFVRPGDLFRPLVLPVKTAGKGAAQKLARQLRHVSQWKFIEGLQNAASPLPESNLQVEFFAVDADGITETPLTPVQQKELQVALTQRPNPNGPGQRWAASLKIKITNQGSADLYVAAPYCSYDFSCSTQALLNPPVVMLSKGESKWLRDHKNSLINFKLNDTVRLFNWPESRETLKLMFSNVPFENIAALELSALPAPTALSRTRSSMDEEDEDRGGKRQNLKSWNSLDYKIVIANPLYNQVDKGELESIFSEENAGKEENADLAHFMTGLYFEKNNGLNGGMTLKSGIQAGEKGLWWNTLLAGANRWSNYWRNRAYNSAAQEFPDRPKMLSEGDSWFQHPTIADIIDHVSKFYPVHCLAAAGDTIRNWARTGKIFEAVAEHQPSMLLLSGGGNDILGEAMVKFLADQYDDAPEGEQSARFFGEIFQPELRALIGEYRTIFSYFKTNNPTMPILVHGYDYPRPLAAESKETSWLGKYLTEKKIMREKDRTGAIRYMMDQFNAQMEALAAEFPGQVYYLNLRGIARDDQWSDEIHPNADGFQDISQRFVLKINELLSAKQSGQNALSVVVP